MTSRRVVVDQAPLALTSTGGVVINLRVLAEGDLERLVGVARELGGRFFIGVVMEGRLLDRIAKHIDDAAADTAMDFGADLVKARRARGPAR